MEKQIENETIRDLLRELIEEINDNTDLIVEYLSILIQRLDELNENIKRITALKVFSNG